MIDNPFKPRNIKREPITAPQIESRIRLCCPHSKLAILSLFLSWVYTYYTFFVKGTSVAFVKGEFISAVNVAYSLRTLQTVCVNFARVYFQGDRK